MTVYVSEFNNADGTWTVTDNAHGHTGSIQPSAVSYDTMPDGTHNHSVANVTCPVCGSSSGHPVGGGAYPASVQQMFVYLANNDGCPCPADLDPVLPPQLAAGHVKTHCEQMDGPGRWQVSV